MRVLITGFVLAIAALAAGCAEDGRTLNAYRATSVNQLIGGDVAMARVGDFILENDKIRVAILDVESSPGPGVFGGTLVDADLRRGDSRFRGGKGMDTLAEVFPFANLLTPKPGTMDVTVIDDGSSGDQAIIRVSGDGFFFLEALAILRLDLVLAFFPNTKAYLHFETDYILTPGASYVKMVSRVHRADPIPADPVLFSPGFSFFTCDDTLDCDGTSLADFAKACKFGPVFDDTGCPTCDCAPDIVFAMENFTGNAEVFTTVLGSDVRETHPGVLGGDWVFFGGQNDLFAPGMGYDEDKEIFDALWEGRDTFSVPLAFPYMAASGDGVSYGYFTVNPEGEPDPQVLVPMITSSATAFGTAGLNCLISEEDDAECDAIQAWSWERYLAIGKGDIASVTEIMYDLRHTVTGTVRGVVRDGVGEPVGNAKVFIVRDPDPTREWTDILDVADENFRATSQPGIMNVAHADVGLDPYEDGDYSLSLPPGPYLIIAADPELTRLSAIQRIEVVADQELVVNPSIPKPASLTLEVTDSEGRLLDAKGILIPYRSDGTLAELDGKRPTWLGLSRLGAGIRQHLYIVGGHHTEDIAPGRYQLTVAHGPEFGIDQSDIVLTAGRTTLVQAIVPREVDTTGWISADFHLHAESSFDSGMPIAQRLISVIVEGLELAVATDHDVLTDYAPTLWQMGFQDRLKTAVGMELSTLELGHFIAFPLDYDALGGGSKGAPEWLCKDGPQIMETLAGHMEPGRDGIRIMAHPRDGFIGYISQLGVNQTDMTREEGFLQATNTLLAESTCDFDAMEVFNAKRFDLIRTPTNGEVVLYNLCMDRINAAKGLADLAVACPELSPDPLTECPTRERFFECQMRFRRSLGLIVGADMLSRTPEEAEALWNHVRDDDADEVLCAPETWAEDGVASMPADVANAPCIHHPGTFDDWLRWLDAGLYVPVTAGSDSHGLAREPGTPRNYVRSSTDRPSGIDPSEIARNMKAGKVVPTFGPFVEVSINGAGSGEVASVAPGVAFDLDLRIQTASWYGVDRIEIYVSGLLQKVITLDHGPEPIVDFDEAVSLIAPADGDGFVVVMAIGTQERNLMRPVYLDVPFGELAIPKVVSLAFGSLPLPAGLDPSALGLSPAPDVPDFSPVYPMAVANPVFLDTDGDGIWSRPADRFPAFCPRECVASLGDEAGCPEGQTCLPSGVCGHIIPGQCSAAPADATPLRSLVEGR